MSLITEKKEWNTPKITVHGDVEEITLGQSTGTHLDRDFPRGTPFGELGFS
jgi:hypothetical protein